MSLRFVVVIVLCLSAEAYEFFRLRIPNGSRVPHPCNRDTIWNGVGHFLDTGTGPRNPFGFDFAAENYIWTKALCLKDSDGDGLTNGQELDDPYCTWSGNNVSSAATKLSHPGICEPWDSLLCRMKNVTHPVFKTQGDWLNSVCTTHDTTCPGKNESGVANVSLRLDNTTVPTKVTTYICQIFDLKTVLPDGDYHLVAVEPIVDNVNVLHHMVLFGCKDAQMLWPGTYECGMLASTLCSDFLSVWTVGLVGDCSHPMAAMRLGLNGYKRVAIQLHWNNPTLRSDLMDSSGLRLFYSPNLRLFDAGIFLLGSIDFYLPPKRPSVTVKSTCTKGCTRSLLKGPINITVAWNHMHYAGIKMSIEILRNNSHYLFLTNDPVYSYDSPQVYTYKENPIQLLMDDEVITSCTFTTAKRNHTTSQGEATMDEMCFGFVTYYPKTNLHNQMCVTFGDDVSMCDLQGCPEFGAFFNETLLISSVLYFLIVDNCKSFSPCLEECLQFMVQLQSTNKCFQGQIFEFIKSHALTTHFTGLDILARMASCQIQVNALLNPAPTTTTIIPAPTTTTIIPAPTTTTTNPAHDAGVRNTRGASLATVILPLIFLVKILLHRI